MDEQTSPAATPTPALRKANWRTGEIGFPALIALLLLLGASGLGAASIGGWGGVAVVVIVLAAFLALITSWAVSG